ncbi:dirigent protein [Streptomyces sp. NRRL F-5727]|uniref:dirigent protein n=1 Tax=Streptomyces sp. NRRL F-5727 TaxID=1463871 RepID=UPI0004CAE735|nr:dirigent protein [Streptomyces sp. NRRL F-5727]
MTGSFRRIGALGAATVAAVAFASAAPVAAAPAVDGFEFTLYAKEVPTDESGEDTGRAPEPGDSFAFADDLSRTKGGESVGRDGVTCTVVRAGSPADLLCVGTFVLNGGPGGQLTGQNLISFDPSNEAPAAFDIAVTGGTGDFRDARGYIRSTPDGDYARLEFHITR